VRGLVNYLLVRLHLVSQPVNFLGSTALALPTLMVADIWKTTPFMALLLLAGLQTIPPGLSDAARIDGASAWGYFWRVRLPLLMPTLLVAGHHSGGSPGRGPGRAARLHSLVE